MEIPEKVVKLRFHILTTLILSLTIFSLILLAPKFASLFTYFSPLLLSTALFLLLIAVIGRSGEPHVDKADEAHVDKAGEGLLNYVAGQPEHHVE